MFGGGLISEFEKLEVRGQKGRSQYGQHILIIFMRCTGEVLNPPLVP